MPSDLSPFALAEQQYASALRAELEKIQLSTRNVHIFLRAFKRERELEVWVRSKDTTAYRLFRTYPFSGYSGTLGPKRKEGDRQIPEGFYHINRFNPHSKFHLSLGLNYPNADDRRLGDPEQPGSDIFIHGGSQTVGCIPITDEKIRELYLLATYAYAAGQQKIPVHIFPFRLRDAGYIRLQKPAHHHDFWLGLLPLYAEFEQGRR